MPPPVQYTGPDKLPTPKVFAAWQLNETIRRESSSGGVFTALAESFLVKGGVVVGAAFDDQLVVRHILIEKVSEIHRLRGSKYVQSEVSPVLYRRIRNVLRAGCHVLFSGTPCQVTGLYAFLAKKYDNLCTCDLVCYGVPSPKVFDVYKTMLEHVYGAKGRSFAFRRKDCGWKRPSVSMSFDNQREYRCASSADPFMRGFFKNIYLRHTCHACRFSCLPRIADISLGDFWGVGDRHPEWDDDRGTSLILIQTEKGGKVLDACRNALVVHEAELKEAIRSNPYICSSVSEGKYRAAFFRDLDRRPFDKIITAYTSPQLCWRVVEKIQLKVFPFIHKLRNAFSP
jgi:coenzyme F420-reducing hydrogenase beta subunit